MKQRVELRSSTGTSVRAARASSGVHRPRVLLLFVLLTILFLFISASCAASSMQSSAASSLSAPTVSSMLIVVVARVDHDSDTSGSCLPTFLRPAPADKSHSDSNSEHESDGDAKGHASRARIALRHVASARASAARGLLRLLRRVAASASVCVCG